MKKMLGELLTEAVEGLLAGRPVIAVPSLDLHTAMCTVLARYANLRDKDLEYIASILSTTFTGIALGFDPHVLLAKCSLEGLAALEREMDDRADGSDGAFIFFQLNRAQRKGLHVDGRPWQFIRHNRYVGEARFALRERTKAGDAMVVVGVQFGQPDLEIYTCELAEEAQAKGGLEFPAETIPGFEWRDVSDALESTHRMRLCETRRGHTKMAVVVPLRGL